MAKDKDLLYGLRRGDQNAFSLLYKEYYPAIERYVTNNSGSVDDAKDVFQDTMVVLIAKIFHVDFALTASLKTYMYAISKNIWLKRIRGKVGKNESELTDQALNDYQQQIEEWVAHERTQTEKVQLLLKKVSDHCYRLLRSMFFLEKNIDEIQDEYGYSSRHSAQNQKYKCIEQARKAK